MVCSVQTVHLSCVKISTICKRNEMSFRLSLITLEYDRVQLKRFMSLWYVRRKPCTYLVSKLALSPNEPKRVSTRARHLGVPSGVSKMIYEPMVLWRKSCTYLAPTLALSLNGPKRDSTLPTSPRCSIECDQNDFQGYGMFGANRVAIVRQD
jgi:hypothetical protein